MAFKNKTKNRNPFNINKTIDALHNNVLKQFDKNKKNIKNYYHNLDLLEKKIIYIREKINIDKLIYKNFKLQEQLWVLEDERDIIKTEIYNIENKKEETEYLLDTGVLLNHYYKIKDNEFELNKFDEIKKTKQTKQTKKTQNDVIGWLENYDNKKYNISNGKQILELRVPKNDTQNDNQNDNQNESNTTLLKKQVKPKNEFEVMTKKELHNYYMKILNNDYNNSEIFIINSDICEFCNTDMLLNSNCGVLICSNCGIQEQVILDSEKPSYKDPPKEMTSFCYKRINHLNEFLAQFQAKEATEIPDDLYNEILVEIKKERIKNMAHITPDKMRIILRKIKRNDYYEHIPYIINQLNGLPPPIISSEVEEIIRNMFKEIQIPFEELRMSVVPKRKNFLSYNYVMYKFFELLELDEYLKCFQLLKSRNKLHQQDIIWKHICNILNWQYIPSL
jgi:hypothetical protein